MSKTIRSQLQNFLDRVLSFNIIFAHIPDKANLAETFFARVKKDKGFSLELTDKVPVREIYEEFEAKSPDILNSNIDLLNIVSESDRLEAIIISRVQIFGLYDKDVERQR